MAISSDAGLKLLIALVAGFVVYKIVLVNTCERSSFADAFDDAPVMSPMSAPGVRLPPSGVASSLLPVKPQDGDVDFSEFAPNVLDGQSFLDPAAFVGVNTVSGSLRIANHSIRANPPNPQIPVGPWNQSTVIPDTQGLADVRA